MIVCVCKGLSDQHLDALIAAGARTAQEVEQACGAGSDCGACRAEVERLVECRLACTTQTRSPTPTLLVRIRR